MNKTYADIIIAGGGAASFFFAANLDNQKGNMKVMLLEQSKQLLSKVRISGGGRCNVTNANEDPRELIKAYPRGSKELLGPFNKFHCGHTKKWFENRGVRLKTEADGRVFPVSDQSEDIIHVLQQGARANHVAIQTNVKVKDFWKDEEGLWHTISDASHFISRFLVLGTGSSTFIWNKLKEKNISIVDSVPSLFTFKLKEHPFRGLEGISLENAAIKISDSKVEPQQGPLLITHEGLSGPAILRSSAFGARELATKEYKFSIFINWLPDFDESLINEIIKNQGKKHVINGMTYLPARLWERLLQLASVHTEKKWAEINKAEKTRMAETIFKTKVQVEGKSTFKEEFVSAGGVHLKEVNFRNFSVRKHENLFCIGEMLDIDAITGGYNFQACWTGGALAAAEINTIMANS